MDEEQEVSFGLVDPLGAAFGNTMASGFVIGNKFTLWPHRPIISSSRDVPTEHANKMPVQIYFLEEEFNFHEPILRSLAAESCATFVALQALKRRGNKSDYCKLSHAYRSITRACIENLQVKLNEVETKLLMSNSEDNTDGDDQDDDENAENTKCDKYKNYITIFYAIECLWHLIEILYMDLQPSNVIVPQLLDWVRFHFPTYEQQATDLLLQGREASENENYWSVIKGLLTQGQVLIARALLKLHPSSDSSAFVLVEQILNTMPSYDVFSTFSLPKFRGQWEYWLTETQRKLTANMLTAEHHLEEIVQIVTCDTKIWDSYIKNSNYWYEYLPGFLHYTNPACKHYELAAYANNFVDRWATLKSIELDEQILNPLDRSILSLMENNLMKVIDVMQKMNDNLWFATHIIDLLYNAGNLETSINDKMFDCVQFRESLVYEYGLNLMTRDNLWQVGMDYLDNCGHEGKAALELALLKIPLHTEKLAFKVLAAVKNRGFTNAEQTICKILSKKSFNLQRYGNALEWALRSKDNLYVTTLADFILKYYAKTGIMLCPDIIANISARMFISPRLVFLVKYFDFYQLYKKNDTVPATELLVNLLESKITPDYFWPTLLIDCLPILEAKDTKLSSKETLVILRRLQTDLLGLIEKQKKDKELIAPKSISDNQDNLVVDYRLTNVDHFPVLLRFACLRNLSRAYIAENTLMD